MTTRIVSMAQSRCRNGRDTTTRIGVEHCRRRTTPCGVRTESARDVRMIGTRAPSTIPAASALDEESKILGEHVAGLEIGHDENLGSARDLEI